jgi:hypothetical protein
MPRDWGRLYSLQDWALSHLRNVRHEFYLTGGTALGRGYYQHRYSEDLDLLNAMEQALGKAAGVFPPVVAQALAEGLSRGLPRVAWCTEPAEEEFRAGLDSWIRRIVG